MELSTVNRFGMVVGVGLLAAGMAAGCGEAQPARPAVAVSPSPEMANPAPDEDTVKTVGGLVIATYDKKHPDAQYPAYSTPKGNDRTGSYGRGEKVAVVCSTAARYLLHDPAEWLDKKAVKVEARVPKCTPDQIPEEYTPEPEPKATTGRTLRPKATQGMKCDYSWGYNPAIGKYEHFNHCHFPGQ